jgi:hypothetical protein
VRETTLLKLASQALLAWLFVRWECKHSPNPFFWRV